MPCRPGALRRHGPSNDLHSLELEHEPIPALRNGTAQLPPKSIRNEQDRLKCIRYSMQHQEEKRACSNASQAISRIGTSLWMTEYLVATRVAIILWTNLAVMPAEILFDAIEAELRRRGVEL